MRSSALSSGQVLVRLEHIETLALIPAQFSRSMLGERSREAVRQFWEHCERVEEWLTHPILADSTVERDSPRLKD